MNRTFRPRTNFVTAGFSLMMVGLFAANSVLVATSTTQLVLELALALATSSLVFLLWVRPKLVLTSEVIKVVNPLRTTVIPYSHVQDMETKWALKIIHTEGQTTVWAAPATGKRRWIADKTFGIYGSRIPLSQSGSADTESMSESLNSLSGQAAYIIREQMKRLH